MPVRRYQRPLQRQQPRGLHRRCPRLLGPLRQAEWIRGRYSDGWTGRRLEYVRRGCVPATLAVTVAADPSLIGKPQQVFVDVAEEFVFFAGEDLHGSGQWPVVRGSMVAVAPRIAR